MAGQRQQGHSLRFDDAVPHCNRGGVRAIAGAQLRQDAPDLPFDRLFGDPEFRRNLPVRQTVGDEPHLIAKMPDHELWMAFFRDGEGNTLALMHEKRG